MSNANLDDKRIEILEALKEISPEHPEGERPDIRQWLKVAAKRKALLAEWPSDDTGFSRDEVAMARARILAQEIVESDRAVLKALRDTRRRMIAAMRRMRGRSLSFQKFF